MTGVKAQAEALLNGITPGEWYAYTHTDGTALYSPRTPRPNEHFAEGEEPVHLIAENMGRVDAELCRNAPTLARQVVELAEEVEKLREALMHAAPMLRMGITYNQKSAHAAHALPGSRDRQRYESEASDALFRLRYDFIQDGAERALAALATQEPSHD